MKDKVCFKSDTSAQILILTGFVIAVIIVGMGTVLYSVANSGQQTSILQSDRAYNNFENIREEYGIALMVSSEWGEIDPFNVSNTTIILEFEDRMKTIVESHGSVLNFTEGKYFSIKKHASVNILFTDGKKIFNDTVTYNLLTGTIVYDTIPPGHILDLQAETWDKECEYDGVVHLNFTAVGDDGYEEGTSATKYEICYSKDEITTDQEFEGAIDADQCGYWLVSELNGSTDHAYIYEVEPGYWYFSIKVYDEANNPSNISQPYGSDYLNVKASPSGWSPEIYNITDFISNEPITETNPVLHVPSGVNVTIKFNVTDKDGDNVNISLMVRNNTDWYEGTNWTNQIPEWYNNESYYYTLSDNISEIWDFYINVTDDDDPCYRNKSSPENAPDNYYSINLTDVTLKTGSITINSSVDIMDAYVDAKSPSANFGYDTFILIETTTTNNVIRGLIWFNISNHSIPPSATITSANISIFSYNVNPSTAIEFCKAITYWDEGSVKWNTQPDLGLCTSSIEYPTNDSFTNWTVIQDVQEYYNNPSSNYGWFIKYIDESPDSKSAKFNSTQAISNTPVLYITYTYYE